jgi:hypothetical protein
MKRVQQEHQASIWEIIRHTWLAFSLEGEKSMGIDFRNLKFPVALRGKGNSQAEIDYKESFVGWTEQLLDQTNLSVAQIQTQTLPELKQSLERINLLIENLNKSIGAAHFKSELVGQASIYTMPLLLDRQKMVIDRIRQLESEEKITKIVTVVRSDAATDVQQEIENMKSMNETWVALSIENERARNEALEAANKVSEETLHRQGKAAAARGPWPALPNFIENESVPTIISAFLVVIIVICLLVFSLFRVVTPQILNDAFLITLGYFFGQAVAKATTRKQD